MNVTREVITDLLPLYLSGEASADTRALVEAFFQADPEFTRLVQADPPTLPQSAAALSGDIELQTLRATRALLRRRTLYLAFALFFSLFSISIRFDNQGVYWMWLDMPILGVIFLAIGLLCAFQVWRTSRRLAGSQL
jgi:hypothetical protein